MRKYQLSVGKSHENSESYPFTLNINLDGEGGALVHRKLYTCEDELRSDLTDCTNPTFAGLNLVMDTLAQGEVHCFDAILSDECAARLGWTE